MTLRSTASLLLVAVVLASCLGRRSVPEGATGPEIYVLQNCKLCHQADGSGSGRAPALQGLRASWSERDLVQYLFDPKPFIDASPRLQELEKKHSLSMPRYHNLTEPQRRVLAAWLLEQFGA